MKVILKACILAVTMTLTACGGKSNVKPSQDYVLSGKPTVMAANDLKNVVIHAEETIYLTRKQNFIDAFNEIKPMALSTTEGFVGNVSKISKTKAEDIINKMKDISGVVSGTVEGLETAQPMGLQQALYTYHQSTINVLAEWEAIKNQRGANLSVVMVHAFTNMERGIRILEDKAAGEHFGLPCFGIICDN